MACYFRDCIVFGQSTKLVNLRTCNQLRTESLLHWHIVRVWCSCLQYHELFGRKARCWASDSDGTGKGSCTHPKLSVTYSIDTLMRWSLGCFSRMTFRQKSRGGDRGRRFLPAPGQRCFVKETPLPNHYVDAPTVLRYNNNNNGPRRSALGRFTLQTSPNTGRALLVE